MQIFKIIFSVLLVGLTMGCSNSGKWPIATDNNFRALITAQIKEGSLSNNIKPSLYVNGTDVEYFLYKVTSNVEECFGPSGYSAALPAKAPMILDLSLLPNGPVSICALGIMKGGQIQTVASHYSWTKIADPILSISDTTVSKGSELQFIASLSSPSDFDTVIDYLTIDDSVMPDLTAHGSTDFVPRSGTIVIPAGKVNGVIQVQTLFTSRTYAVKMGLRIIKVAGAHYSGIVPAGFISPNPP